MSCRHGSVNIKYQYGVTQMERVWKGGGGGLQRELHKVIFSLYVYNIILYSYPEAVYKCLYNYFALDYPI